MSLPKLAISLMLLIIPAILFSQKADSVIKDISQLPNKYIRQVDDKVDKYYKRITNKTEKTLEKLARWENKIKALLQKASPETAQRLFGNNQITFTTLLEKYKQGKAVTEDYRKQYDEYKDKLSSTFDYLDKQKEQINSKLVKPVKEVKEKIKKLEEQEDNTEAVQQFIQERKKQLIDQSLQYIGKSKYLAKINKESYYYIETLKNYKEIFHDKKKAEETALTILNKIPAFQKFFKENSMLASLFRVPGSQGGGTPNLAGLQTRASVNSLIQQRIAAGGPNAQQQITQNIQAAQEQLQQLKDKIIKAGGGNSSDAELPNFKPNQTKTKTFKQRLELGSNFQFGKDNSLMPTTADIAMSAGYKLNDKSVIGIGASYKLGLGSIQRIRFTNEGIGLRSFLDWKLKKQFYVSGGFEMNYLLSLPMPSTTQLQVVDRSNGWQQAALIGLSKKMNIKTKWFKATKLSLMYDFLAREHVPVSQPTVFRLGYVF